MTGEYWSDIRRRNGTGFVSSADESERTTLFFFFLLRTPSGSISADVFCSSLLGSLVGLTFIMDFCVIITLGSLLLSMVWLAVAGLWWSV